MMLHFSRGRARMLAAATLLFLTHAVLAGDTAELGKRVPDFTLFDVTGNSHSLSDFTGKIVVLEWTNPICPFVQRVYREGLMTGVQQRCVNDSVVWLTINSTNTSHRDHRSAEELLVIYREWKAGFTALLVDTDGRVGRMMGARTTPHMFIVSKDGVLVYNGAFDDDARGNKIEKMNYVQTALDQLLAGTPVTTASAQSYGCSVKY